MGVGCLKSPASQIPFGSLAMYGKWFAEYSLWAGHLPILTSPKYKLGGNIEPVCTFRPRGLVAKRLGHIRAKRTEWANAACNRGRTDGRR